MKSGSAMLASVCALPILCLTAPAWAEDACPKLVLLDSLPMTPVPGGARMTIPATVNGTARQLLVATGAGATTLTQTAGKSLKLTEHFNDYQKLLDFNGYASTHYFTLDSLKIGRLGNRDVKITETPDPAAGADGSFDGTLGAELLSHFDVEMDFAGGKLNLFSPKHCPGKVIYWQADAIGVAPITLRDRGDDQKKVQGADNSLSEQMTEDFTGQMMPLPIMGTDIRTTVELDGKTFTADIDTGMEISTLNTDSANAAWQVTSQSEGSAAADRPIDNGSDKRAAPAIETVVVNGQNQKSFQHSFNSLVFGGVTVTNPLFLVRPDQTGAHDRTNRLQTGSKLLKMDDYPRPEITIGMNVLRRLHLYFSFQEHTLYITAAAQPSAQK